VTVRVWGVGGFGEVWRATNPHPPDSSFKFCTDAVAAKALPGPCDDCTRPRGTSVRPEVARGRSSVRPLRRFPCSRCMRAAGKDPGGRQAPSSLFLQS
jgi:hypothetical protein